MDNLHILAQLKACNPRCEIWWDSSPFVFTSWKRSFLEHAPVEKKELWEQSLASLFNPLSVNSTIITGVTTNPRLSLAAIQSNIPHWSSFIQARIKESGLKATAEAIFWETYCEVVRQGAEHILPLWQASSGKYGWISAQLDPRCAFDIKSMRIQAASLIKISPNIMIKCPGTKEGIALIRELSGSGISTNCTLSFSLPQTIACMKAVDSGMLEARRKKINLDPYKSVITYMSSRYEKMGDFAAQAQARGISLSQEDIFWGSIAIFKRACSIAEQTNHTSTMLISSMRPGPSVTNSPLASCWHIEKLAGAPAIFTCPPLWIEWLTRNQENIAPLSNKGFKEEIPKNILEKLLKIPYFKHAYEPNGMEVEDFDHYTPLVATAAEFTEATNRMVDFVEQQFGANHV